jgi:hypothetical protein
MLLFESGHESVFWLAMVFIFMAAYMARGIMKNPIFDSAPAAVVVEAESV